MRSWAWACLLGAAVLLGGCWDRTEIEDVAYVVTMGIDAVDNECLWTFQVVEAGRLPVGMLTLPVRQTGVGLAADTITVRGCTLEQAVQLAQASIVRVISLAQLRYIVFGEDLARRGLAPVLSDLLRHGEVRRGAGVQVARGRAVDVLARNRPLGESNPVRFMEGVLLVQKRMHLSPPIRLQHFYGRLLAPGGDPFLPLVAVNPRADEPLGSPLPPMGTRSLQAGQFPRNGGNPIEMAGVAIFRGDRMVGALDVDRTMALLALRGEMGKVYATVPDPQTPGEYVSMRFHQEYKPRYQADFVGRKPVIRVQFWLEGELLSAPAGADYTQPERRRALERHAASYWEEKMLSPLIRQVHGEWGADPVGFGHLFRSRFPTFDAWLDYGWAERAQELQVSVESRLRIRRFGMLLGGGVEAEGR